MSAQLAQAAQAVIDRWDSPKWEWISHGPTADLIADLRKALAAFEAAPQQDPVAWQVWWGLGKMRLNSVHIEKATADEVASRIRSYTEVRPVYAAPQHAGRADAQPVDKLDAERYRWLRDFSVPPHNFYLSVPVEFDGVRYTPDEVDSAIDAARAMLAARAEKGGT